MTKAELRKTYLEKRKQLTPAEYQQLNYQLCEHFFAAVDLSFTKVLHVFIPIEKNNEPNSWLLIDRIRREFPHIRLVVPKVNSETNTLENFFFEGLHQLQPNSWGILEPKQGVPAESQKIDMVLVPLLVVDRQGQRVGYGKGFYDRFLTACRPNCQKIGLSLFEPVDVIDDIDNWDVALNGCVTPMEYFDFNQTKF